MKDYRSMSHTKWQCKYHVVFILKYRRQALYGVVKKNLGEVFHRLAHQRESEIEEGHIMSDHIHMLISIPPKYSVSSVVGYIKGESAIHVARHFIGKSRNYAGQSFWARGYFVDSVGLDAEMIRDYIRNQEKLDKAYDQMELPGTNEQ